MTTIANRLPAISENTFLRYFSFMALYLAQGIPEGMCLFAVPAWMAMNGKTPGEIGSFVAVFGLPWSFKLVVAPLMDRFSFLPMGRRRPWVIFGQVGLVASFIAMAFVPDPLNNLGVFMASGFSIGFFGAFQDVATDGMAIDVVPVNQQARANGFMWGSKIAGTSASLAIGTWLLNKYGFSIAVASLSIMVCLIMLVPLLLRERPGEKLLPWTKGVASPENLRIKVDSWSSIGKSLYKVFSLRNSLLFTVIAFLVAASCNYMDTLLPIFTVKALGWTNESYSRFYATASLVGGISGMLIGGMLIDKFGKRRMLNIYFLLMVLLVSTLSFVQQGWSNRVFIAGFMMCYQVLYVFTLIGIFSMAMQCCWKKTAATQFTLYMAISNLGRALGAKSIGPVKEHLSWQYTLFAFVLVIAAAWITLQFTHVEVQEKRVAEIDANEMVPVGAALA